MNYKILSICLLCAIIILLIILSIIIYNVLKNKQNNKTNILIDENNKNKINYIIPKEKNSNSSIFDIVYNDIIFHNYINGDFFSKLSNSKTIFYANTHDLDNQAWRVTKNYTVLISHNSDFKIDSSKLTNFFNVENLNIGLHKIQL